MRFLLGIFISLVVFGCGIMSVIFGMPQPYIQRDVNNSELVDTWTVTAESAAQEDAFIARHPTWSATVPFRAMSLSSDGTCKVDIETKWRGDQGVSELPTAKTGQDSLPSCTWELASIPSVENTNVTGIVIDCGMVGQAPLGAHLFINEENGGLTLWNFIGDPDDFITLDYRKSP